MNRFRTWLIIAFAAAVFVAGAGWLGWYIDLASTSTTTDPSPGPTATVTETYNKQAPRRPQRTVTETVEVKVPGPTVTTEVTKTVPGPTVTKTETVTATPDETVLGASLAPQPMVLNIDTAVDQGWQVERAARIWNKLLGCKAFTTKIPAKPGAGQVMYWVTQVEPGTLKRGGQYVRAWHQPASLDSPHYPMSTIEFDPKWGVESFIPIHELGHALGLHHNDEPGSIMNVTDPDRTVPNEWDVLTAQTRCS